MIINHTRAEKPQLGTTEVQDINFIKQARVEAEWSGIHSGILSFSEVILWFLKSHTVKSNYDF